jgi:DNA-binding transcriptional LysR family regulator
VQSSTTSIEIRHLRYFVAVAEEGSFTRAARMLHMAQPPLSAQIRQLERRVGGELFVRGTGPIQLTDAGMALLDFAYAAIGAIRRGVAAAQAARSGACTTLKVIAGHTVDIAPLLDGFDRLRRRRPGIRLDLSRTDKLEQRVADGEADAALLREPIVDPALWQGVVSTEPMAAVFSVDHPLASNRRPTIADLLAHDTLELAEGAMSLGRTCISPDELLAGVVNNQSIGILPARLIPGAESGLTVRMVDGLGRTTTLIVRRRATNISAVIALTALIVRRPAAQ